MTSTAATLGHGAAEPRRFQQTLLRYFASALGPTVVSGAHFLVSLVLLRTLSRTDFGLFSFVLVVVPFCLSSCTALLSASITTLVAKSGEGPGPATLATHFKASLVLAATAALFVALFTCVVGASPLLAAILGCYGSAMTLRWFARSYAYAMRRPLRAALSDIAYAASVIAGVGGLFWTNQLSLTHCALVLLCAALLGLFFFGSDYLAGQFRPGREGSLKDYGIIWQQMTRWSLAGVVLTELTANAHSYLVTLLSGPGAFAILAVGGLAMRPVSLVFAALPDLERPAMARAIAGGNAGRALRIVKEFRTAIGAMWVGTVVLAFTVLLGFPHLMLRKGYDPHQALLVVTLYAAIMAVKALRTPEAVLLQAAGEFRPLARASAWSSMVALFATLALLLIGGPIASLGGILAGEATMAGNIFRMSQRWKLGHG